MKKSTKIFNFHSPPPLPDQRCQLGADQLGAVVVHPYGDVRLHARGLRGLLLERDARVVDEDVQAPVGVAQVGGQSGTALPIGDVQLKGNFFNFFLNFWNLLRVGKW